MWRNWPKRSAKAFSWTGPSRQLYSFPLVFFRCFNNFIMNVWKLRAWSSTKLVVIIRLFLIYNDNKPPPINNQKRWKTTSFVFKLPETYVWTEKLHSLWVYKALTHTIRLSEENCKKKIHFKMLSLIVKVAFAVICVSRILKNKILLALIFMYQICHRRNSTWAISIMSKEKHHSCIAPPKTSWNLVFFLLFCNSN